MRLVITRREGFDIGDGINSFVFNLSAALVERGHEVHLVTPTSCEASSIQRNFDSPQYTALHVLGQNTAPTHLDMASIWWTKGRKLVERLNPDLVIVNGVLPISMPAPSCVVAHDLERRWYYGALGRRLFKLISYRLFDKLVVTTSELRDGVAREIRMSRERIDVIPTCVNCRSFRSYRLEERESAIVHMGTPLYKQPNATIEAFARLDGPTKLYITGRKTPEIVDAVGRLPQAVQSRISLLGILPAAQLRELLGRVRVVSVPSVYDTPVASPTVLESFASGTPVVSTRSVSRDVFQDGKGGYRFEPGDSKSAAGFMRELLTNDENWKAHSSTALQQAQQFDAHVVAERYLNLASGLRKSG